MKTIIQSAIAFVLCTLYASNSDAQNWEWALSAGGQEVDFATGIVNDSYGNVFVAGSFYGTASFGEKRLTSLGYYDIFIAKFTADGKLVWVTQAGGPDGDEANGIAIDEKNNIYVTGYFTSTASFGKNQLKSNGDKDFFLAKLNSDGNFEWVKSGGGKLAEFGKAVAADNKGNVFVTGILTSTSNFKNFTLNSNGKEDIFIADYSDDGDLRWIKSVGGGGRDEATALATDGNGNAYVTGWFSGIVNFGRTQMTSNGDDDIFVAKYDSKGVELWARQAGGFKGVDRSFGITTDAEGNAFVTGSFDGAATFGHNTLKSIGTDDCFVAKYGPDGTVAWVKQSGGKNSEKGRAIKLDSSGNIYVAGEFNASFAVSPTHPSEGDWDIFVVKYDEKGNVLGTNQAGGKGYDRPIAISIDKDSNVYLTGVYEKDCRFGKQELINQGNSDIFIAKTKEFESIK
ncbi:MAG: SBBP repeat-containing protein [Bacteroidetes bacterium]|nr:SBBP repeat-containing protein [Bacteroidota bacterium]